MKFSIFSVQDHYPGLPRSIAQFYREILDQMELAEELGFHTYWIAEHHFHEYGVVPSPQVFLAAASQRTKRLRLGVAVNVLPFGHPIRLAEQWAMVDVLSGGRLDLGVGSGYLKHEFEGFNILPEEKRSRFDEALEIMRRAWRGENVAYEGRFNKIPSEARLNVETVQKPHPPLWVAILRPEAAYYVGKQGLQVMSIPYASFDRPEEVAPMIEAFRKGYQEAGLDPKEADIPLAFHTYVSTSDGAARAECEAALENYLSTRLYAKRADYNQLRDRGFLLAGSPETVARHIQRVQQLTGFNHIMLLMNFGGLEHEKVCRSMRLFAEEVFPRVTPQLASKRGV